jgi:SAM-dependent methyltransferase
MIDFGTADYYLPAIPRILTALFQCPDCGALYRLLEERQLRSHYDASTYTNPRFEDQFRKQRTRFFRHLASLATRHAGVPGTCLDFGCSYGHLLLLLREMGSNVCGIELCDQARNICQSHELCVFKSLDELHPSLRFDLVTFIDSLYYVPDPRTLLQSLRERLSPDGRVLIRVANRNWILQFLKSVRHRTEFGSWLGDAIIGYSKSNLELLLRKTGYRVIGTRYWEPGKVHADWKTQMFYWTTSAITCASFGSIAVSPGIIVVAEKQD